MSGLAASRADIGRQISPMSIVPSLPLIGVNTFLPKEHAGETATTIELIRSTEEEKGQQITNVEALRANRNPLTVRPEVSKGELQNKRNTGARKKLRRVADYIEDNLGVEIVRPVSITG